MPAVARARRQTVVAARNARSRSNGGGGNGCHDTKGKKAPPLRKQSVTINICPTNTAPTSTTAEVTDNTISNDVKVETEPAFNLLKDVKLREDQTTSRKSSLNPSITKSSRKKSLQAIKTTLKLAVSAREKELCEQLSSKSSITSIPLLKDDIRSKLCFIIK